MSTRSPQTRAMIEESERLAASVHEYLREQAQAGAPVDAALVVQASYHQGVETGLMLMREIPMQAGRLLEAIRQEVHAEGPHGLAMAMDENERVLQWYRERL